MTSSAGGVFPPAARAAILEATGDRRCAGCGHPQVTCQHRRARAMGGTSLPAAAHPANGVALCGDGVRGCHGWAEAHPEAAELLGWRLAPGDHPLEAPFYTRLLGWRRWVLADRDVLTVYVDEDDLDRLGERRAALDTYHRWRARVLF